MARCLITGCRLFAGARSVWGDLFGCDNDTIFVFATDLRDGRPIWRFDTEWSEGERAVLIKSDDYFDRHGIFTFARDNAKLSEAAIKRLSWTKS